MTAGLWKKRWIDATVFLRENAGVSTPWQGEIVGGAGAWQMSSVRGIFSHFLPRIRGQIVGALLSSGHSMPLLSLVRRRLAVWGLFLGAPVLVFAQSAYLPQGSEFSITRGLPGDQTYPQVSLTSSVGYLVWQDNTTDGDGLGISAQRLDGTLSGSGSVFRVNKEGAGDQEKPQVAMLKNGGAIIVWQGGKQGAQKIYARFLGATGTFVTSDVAVSSFTGNQLNPVATSLSDGTLVVVWSSFGQDGDMLGVFGQRFTADGQKLGDEFQVNQFTTFNQRTPAIAGLNGGGFVVAWASEQQRFQNSVDLYARLYTAAGVAQGNEFRLNSTTNVCANPSLAPSADGGFIAAWSQMNLGNVASSWDVFVRAFDPLGKPVGLESPVNTHTPGRQYAPRIAIQGSDALVVWTSDWQDGSREGVFGRFLADGKPVGEEIAVNHTTVSQQLHPTVTGDGSSRFLVVWTSFVGSPDSFDLYSQRYVASQALAKPAPPYISALSQSKLSVTWPEVSGLGVSSYELFMDDNTDPIVLTNRLWVGSQFVAGSTHSFKLAYRLAEGQRSPLSDPATGTTWASDDNLDGLPDDWQARYWGGNSGAWPDRNADSDGDGATNLQEFLAGTNPLDPNSVLRTEIISTGVALRLQWNAQPGFVYQVQMSTDANAGWSDIGSPRLALEATDSLIIDKSGQSIYYRLKRIR
jgi:hypothetical protein